MPKLLYVFFSLIIVTLAVSCSQTTSIKTGKKLLADGRYLSSHEGFVNSPDYLRTGDVWYHDSRIHSATVDNSQIEISLSKQRGLLKVNNKVAMDFPVCTGKHTYETPRGSFKITQKVEEYQSHTYGRLFDKNGVCINGDAKCTDSRPAGGKFVGAVLPLWMRIHGGVGFHVGEVYREARSHGCIRVPIEPCSLLFKHCDVGTKVVIHN